MKTHICPTCGCSLVRLGINSELAATHNHEGEQRYFCCQGCVDLFVTDPGMYLNETRDLIVCPSCLAASRRVEHRWAGCVVLSLPLLHRCVPEGSGLLHQAFRRHDTE